jgi:glycosyltransferase involved in cell wall biosynthesis
VPAKFDRVLITSEKDKSALLDLAGSEGKTASVTILANGVDLAYFQGGETLNKDPSLIVLSGKMSYHANITMALFLGNEVMPLVWKRRPDARLVIVGKDPPSSVQTLTNHPAITVTGTVEDLRPYLRKAAVAAVPMIYGAGVQNKLLEAMACGTPVVATPIAIMDWEVQPGTDLLVAENALDFANKIVSLLDNAGYQKDVGEAGKRFVEKHHSWTQISKKLEGIYHEVIHAKHQ